MGGPEVTGVSPKEGLPGTEVKIRGVNFGNSAYDLVSLTICGCDCTLSAEWKSSKLIVARTGPGQGVGEIIVTTKSGGKGTSLVNFRGYHETIGPTKESAVWKDTFHHTLSWARRSLSPTDYQQEDPLGLSVEGHDKVIPEDDLNELFPGCSGDLGSDKFSAGWFLLEYHHSTSFEDLKAGLSYLRRKVDNQKEGQLSFLKANVGSVVDQLDTLNKLKEKAEFDSKNSDNFTGKLELKIDQTKIEALKLFEDALSRREQADAARSALSVLQRFKFLFCLPSSIERNTQTGDYDLIINEYARVKHLFGSTDVTMFQTFMNEVENRIESVRNILLKKLEDPPVAIDEYIKIIRNLVHLEATGDIPWLAIECFSKYLNQGMSDLKDKFIVLESSESAKKGKTGLKPLDGKPHRVYFVEDLVDWIEIKLTDLWKLGQTYFGGEFQDVNPANHTKFKTIVLNCIDTFCNLLRAAILPHSLNRNSQTRHTYGIWSNSGFEAVLPWLPHCLLYFRACYSCFIRIDLPSDALDIFSKLIFELRRYIVLSHFRQASEDIMHLSKKENWVVDMNETYGGITELPNKFDETVRAVIQTAYETVLIGEAKEVQLLENPTARKDIRAATKNLITSFADVLETLASITDKDPGERASVVSQLIGTSDVPKAVCEGITWEQRLLAASCNCDYIIGSILPSLFELMTSLGYPVNNEFLLESKTTFSSLSQKIIDQYHEQKCDPLVGTIEPSMYQPKFDWDTIITPTDVRPYAKEIIMNLIGVRSELHRVPQNMVYRIISRIVETIAEELARLMSCVKTFSIPGCIQATADILAIKDATKVYLTEKSKKFYTEALESIPKLNDNCKGLLQEILTNFRSRMALQLLCLDEQNKKMLQ